MLIHTSDTYQRGATITLPLRPEDDMLNNFVYEVIESLYPLNFAEFMNGADVKDPQAN